MSEERRVWPEGEGLSEGMDEAMKKMIGLVELFYSASGELSGFHDYVLEGMTLSLWETMLEVRNAYHELCKPEDGGAETKEEKEKRLLEEARAKAAAFDALVAAGRVDRSEMPDMLTSQRNIQAYQHSIGILNESIEEEKAKLAEAEAE
jgi:hypothetical protein